MRPALIMVSVALWLGVSMQARAISAGCHDEVMALLAMPNSRTLDAVSGAGDQPCWAVIASSNEKLDKLLHFVEGGNRSAAEYLAGHLNTLDGGNLEDSLVALGQFSDHRMEALLDFAKDGRLSEHELREALTMLPLSLSDNPRAQLNVLKARRRCVTRVSRKDLAQVKDAALNAIDDFLAEIKAKNLATTG